MSQVYATEPATSGRVVMETTHGPLEIQLWCRECPLTTRFFLQLCMDGFYDNMIFHRVVPDFLIQTGAVRHSSSTHSDNKLLDDPYRQAVQADEQLERQKYEVHSRLKFNHRGQVAMALQVTEDTVEIQPQFFVTLEEAPYLDGKHVLFGTITGPTMFNALRIGRTEVDEEHLQDAPRIASVKIVDNAVFTDLVPQTHVPWKAVKKEEAPAKKKKKKRKGKKDFNVLSFGDEMEEETEGAGMKSSHDVVKSDVLSNRVDSQVQEAAVAKGAGSSSKEPSATRPKRERGDDGEAVGNDGPMSGQDRSVKQPDHEQLAAELPKTGKDKRPEDTRVNGNHAEAASRELQEPRKSEKPRKTSALEVRLAKYKKSSATDKKRREEDTMSKLFAFQGKVRKQVVSKKQKDDGPKDDALAARMARKLQEEQDTRQTVVNDAPTYRGQVLEYSDDEQGQESWLSTKFKCRKHIDHTSGGDDADPLAADGRTMDEYHVVDEKRDRKRHKHSSSHRHHRKEHKKHRHR